MAPPKGKKTLGKNMKKDRFKKSKGSRARPRVSTCVPPPPPEGFGSVGVGSSSQAELMVITSPPSPPRNFASAAQFTQQYNFGMPNSSNWSSANPQSGQPNNDALVEAIKQAVQAVVPTIVTAVEQRIADKSKSVVVEEFPLPTSYAAITAMEADDEEASTSSQLRKNSRKSAAADDDEQSKGPANLYCQGFTDSQINLFLMKTGFIEVAGGAALRFGRTVVVKSGLINMWSGHPGQVSIPNPMNHPQWLAIRNYYRRGHQLIFIVSRDLVDGLWLSRQNFHGPYSSRWDRAQDHACFKEDAESHTAALWLFGHEVKMIDVNNFDGNQGTFVDRFRHEVQFRAYDHIMKNMRLDKNDFNYALLPTLPPLGVSDCCAVHMLFNIEQIAHGHPNLELCRSRALAQIFFKKLNHFVGGDYSFKLFKRRNPLWKTDVTPFPAEDILSGLKAGLTITDSKLREYLFWLSPYGIYENKGEDEDFITIKIWKKK